MKGIVANARRTLRRVDRSGATGGGAGCVLHDPGQCGWHVPIQRAERERLGKVKCLLKRVSGQSQDCARPVGVCSPQPTVALSAAVLLGSGSSQGNRPVSPGLGPQHVIGDLRALWWDRLPAGQTQTVGGTRVSPGNKGGVSWLQMGARGKRGHGKESWTWGSRGCCLR